MPKVADPQRAAETEAAILDAARDVLAEEGLEALSMRAVAARVGLSATSLYNYVENKQALVDRVVARGFRRFESYMWRAVDGVPSGGFERLQALGSAYLRFARENEQYFKIMFTIQPEDPREIEELPGEGGRRILREAVADAIAAGKIRAADPDLVALYLWSSAHGLATLSLACDVTCDCSCGCRNGGECTCDADNHEWGTEGITAEKVFELFGEFLREGLRPRDGQEDAAVSKEVGRTPAASSGTGSNVMDEASQNGGGKRDA
ncbi:MAG: TetR/AcrR family transcriptional regulator [Gemmatimonadales bacterium]